VQEVSGESIERTHVDQGHTGEEPAEAAQAHGIRLDVIGLPEARRGLMLLLRRWGP